MPNSTITKNTSWRDVLLVHPAAELFPLMDAYDPEALQALADDIKKNGLREKVSIYNDPVIGDCVLDGRNRLDALLLIDQLWDETGELRKDIASLVGSCSIHYPNFDPYAYVISKNIHRRHLTPDDKRKLIAKVLKANPKKSDRQIAKETRSYRGAVATERKKLESTGSFEPVKKRLGADGKERKVPCDRKTSRPKRGEASVDRTTTQAISGVVQQADSSGNGEVHHHPNSGGQADTQIAEEFKTACALIDSGAISYKDFVRRLEPKSRAEQVSFDSPQEAHAKADKAIQLGQLNIAWHNVTRDAAAGHKSSLRSSLKWLKQCASLALRDLQ